VQVEPIKPTLKAPGPQRLKLNCDVLLSTSAFKLNLRRYIKVIKDEIDKLRAAGGVTALGESVGAGGGGGGGTADDIFNRALEAEAYTRSLLSST